MSQLFCHIPIIISSLKLHQTFISSNASGLYHFISKDHTKFLLCQPRAYSYRMYMWYKYNPQGVERFFQVKGYDHDKSNFLLNSCKPIGRNGKLEISRILLNISCLFLTGRFRKGNGYEMINKAWSSIGEVPYCFSRSSIKFQGHTGQNIANFNPNWAFPDCNSSFNSQMDLKWCTKLDIV